MAITPTGYRRLVGGVWTSASMHYLSGGSWLAHGVTPITADFTKSAGAAMAATPKADSTPPTVPTNVVATGGTGQATLTWTASTDAVGVTGYRIYRNTTSTFSPPTTGTLAGTSVTNSYTDSVAAGTYYYKVAAYDAAGNTSAYSAVSNAATVTASAFTHGVQITRTNVGLAGAGVSEASLTSYTGNYLIGGTGTTYDRRRFSGDICVIGKNITFTNCLFVLGSDAESGTVRVGRSIPYPAADGTSTDADEGMYATFVNCEFRASSWTNTSSDTRRAIGIFAHHVTIRRCYIHHCRSGIKMYADNQASLYSLIEECWIGDNASNTTDHCTNIAGGGGKEQIIVRRCNIYGPASGNNPGGPTVTGISGAIASYPEYDNNAYETYDSNYINSGPGGEGCNFGWTPAGYAPDGSQYPNHHFTFTNNYWGNVFGTNDGGPDAYCGAADRNVQTNGSAWTQAPDNNVWTGNYTFNKVTQTPVSEMPPPEPYTP